MTTEVTGTRCKDKQEPTPTLTQHNIKAAGRKEKERVKITIKETEGQKNLATIAVFLDTRLVTVEGDSEKRKKSKTRMKREQKKLRIMFSSLMRLTLCSHNTLFALIKYLTKRNKNQ